MLGDISHVESIYIRTEYTDMRKQLDGLVLSSNTASNSIHTVIPCSCFVADRRTGEEAKQISEQQLRWLLEGLNPEQPKAVQKCHPKYPDNL